MKAFVVDTNVAVVANGQASQARPDCVLACAAALAGIKDNGKIVLDSGMLILKEYLKDLGLAGKPGLGQAFVKWVFDNQAVAERCERVAIRAGDGSFREFPDAPELARFHIDDHKYVAVALASRNRPKVLNAVDSDWWTYRKPLRQHGVRVRNLCPRQFSAAVL
jgi:hypothetical protein